MADQLDTLLDSIVELLPSVLAPGRSCSLERLGHTQQTGKSVAQDKTGEKRCPSRVINCKLATPAADLSIGFEMRPRNLG